MLGLMVNGDTGAFGPIPATSTRRISGAERRADEHPGIDPWPVDIRDRLDERTARSLGYFQFVIAAAAPDLPRWNTGAAGMVLNHALNDILALISDVVEGHGRSAARAARAMFEHLINYADVTSSEESADRYVSHRYVTESLIAQRVLYFRSQGKRATPQPTKVQKTLRRSSLGPLKEAINKYGAGFQRGYTPVTLKVRAERFGFAEAYDGYKILSGVMHGAAGGILGTQDTINGYLVNRTGPDLRLAGIAYVEGLTWWCQLIERVVKRGATSRIEMLLEASHDLREAWPQLMDALDQLDRELWPKVPPPPVTTVLALYPNGVRWYVHRPLDQTLTLALPPSGEEVDKALETARQMYVNYRPEDFGGRPMSIALLHITVDEKPGAPTVAAASILVPDDIRHLEP